MRIAPMYSVFYKWREFRPQIVPVNSRSGRRQSEFYIFEKRV